MSTENEHVVEIRLNVLRLRNSSRHGNRWFHAQEILNHAEGLAQELGEAEAQVIRTESLLFANWGVNGTDDITPAMERTLHYARTGEQLGEVDSWPHLDDDGEVIAK